MYCSVLFLFLMFDGWVSVNSVDVKGIALRVCDDGGDVFCLSARILVAFFF